MTHVTNHAIRRYVERVMGIDVGSATDNEVVAGLPERQAVVDDICKIVSRGVTAGAPIIRFDGHRYIMKYGDAHGSVLTVTPRVVKRRLRSGRARRGGDE
jgi:hypothetical protein